MTKIPTRNQSKDLKAFKQGITIDQIFEQAQESSMPYDKPELVLKVTSNERKFEIDLREAVD